MIKVLLYPVPGIELSTPSMANIHSYLEGRDEVNSHPSSAISEVVSRRFTSDQEFDTLRAEFKADIKDIAPEGVLTARISYASIAAMNADVNPIDQFTNESLKKGQLVIIVNPSNALDTDNGKIYRFIAGWEYIGKVGSVTANGIVVNTAGMADPSLVDLQKVATKVANGASVYNISAELDKYDYANDMEAIEATPAGVRKVGMLLRYRNLSGVWVQLEFIGYSKTVWSTLTNWNRLIESGLRRAFIPNSYINLYPELNTQSSSIKLPATTVIQIDGKDTNYYLVTDVTIPVPSASYCSIYFNNTTKQFRAVAGTTKTDYESGEYLLGGCRITSLDLNINSSFWAVDGVLYSTHMSFYGEQPLKTSQLSDKTMATVALGVQKLEKGVRLTFANTVKQKNPLWVFRGVAYAGDPAKTGVSGDVYVCLESGNIFGLDVVLGNWLVVILGAWTVVDPDTLITGRIPKINITKKDTLKIGYPLSYFNDYTLSGTTFSLDALGPAVIRTIYNVSCPAGVRNYIHASTSEGKSLYPIVTQVVDHTTQAVLVEGIDYTIHNVGNVGDPDNGYRTISCANTTVVDITVSEPMARYDMVLLDTRYNTVSVRKGVEHNTDFVQDLWYNMLNYICIAKVYLSHNSSDITAIYNTVDYDLFGQSSLEQEEAMGSVYANSSRLKYFRAEIDKKSQDPYATMLRTTKLNIGFVGDSRTASDQPQLVKNGILHGYPFVFMDTFRKTYPKLNGWGYSVLEDGSRYTRRNFNGAESVDVEFFNHAKGGHNIQAYLHDGSGHFDRNQLYKTSVLYDNTNTLGHKLAHDLMVLACFNNTVPSRDLLKSVGSNYYNNVGDTATMKLYDLVTLPKNAGGYYGLVLPTSEELQSLYNTGGSQALAPYNKLVYKAMYSRIIEGILSNNPNTDIIMVIGFHDVMSQVYRGWPDIYKDQMSWMLEIASDYGIATVNIEDLYINSERRLGITSMSTCLPEGDIHPCILTHYAIARRISNIILPQIN